MPVLNNGDRVKVLERAQSAEDVKSGLYFAHFAGLTGAVQKVYPTGEVAVEVDLGALTDDVYNRHIDIQEQMKAKWLDGLSEEARGRLSDQERAFALRYTILVADKDVEATSEEPPVRQIAPVAAVVEPQPATPAYDGGGSVDDRAEEPAPHRKTEEEYETAEDAYLRERMAVKQEQPE